jgi:hypothetical protein
MQPIIRQLAESKEPSIRFKVRVRVLGEGENSPEVRQLRNCIKRSVRVQALLGDRDQSGRVRPVGQVYRKWAGAHWVLATLADLGYPPADQDLMPILDQVLDCWIEPTSIQEHIVRPGESPYGRRHGVPIINGRARRCASQQGNALFSAVSLGLIDARCHQLADLLLRWQWPDGGWNCDRQPEASISSFWESLIPLRALAAYAKATGRCQALQATERAAELFLSRHLYLRRRDGQPMNPQFLRLHYPTYWRYDVLFGLKVVAEAGFIGDPRCRNALDLLGSRQLPDGGWPAEERFYQNTNPNTSGYDLVSWGGVSRHTMNEWVTADALYVLRMAGRLDGQGAGKDTEL